MSSINLFVVAVTFCADGKWESGGMRKTCEKFTSSTLLTNIFHLINMKKKNEKQKTHIISI